VPHGESPRHRRRGRGVQGARAPAARSSPEVPAPGGPVRLQKLLASAGFGSRRSCEAFLRDGRVEVNGQPAKLGDSADPAVDRVSLDGERLQFETATYWILNKPEGVVTTVRDPEGRQTVMHLLPSGLPRLVPVGRLDVATSGLVLLTNDGDLAHTLLHPSLGNEREYQVRVRGHLAPAARTKLERGIHLEEGRTSPATVRALRTAEDPPSTTFGLILREGRKRQIRRSLAALGHPVRKLERVRIGPIRLGDLPRGEARPLTLEEIEALRSHAKDLQSQATKGGRSRPRSRRR